MDNATAIAAGVGVLGFLATFILQRVYYPLGYWHLLWAFLVGLAVGVIAGGVNLIILAVRGGTFSVTNLAEIFGMHVWGGMGLTLPCILIVNCVFDTAPAHDVAAVVVEPGAQSPTFEVETSQPFAGLTFAHANDPRILSFSNKRLFVGDRRVFTIHPGVLGGPWASGWRNIERRP